MKFLKWSPREPDSHKKNVKIVIESFLDVLMEELKRGKSVSFNKFGHFFIQTLKERKARNPQTGEPIIAGIKKE